MTKFIRQFTENFIPTFCKVVSVPRTSVLFIVMFFWILIRHLHMGINWKQSRNTISKDWAKQLEVGRTIMSDDHRGVRDFSTALVDFMGIYFVIY